MSIALIYHNEERDRAARIVMPLIDSGYNVSFAPIGIQIGTEEWKRRVLDDLLNSELVLILLTKKSVMDEWVAWRAKQVLDRGDITFIPVRLDGSLTFETNWKLPKRIRYYNWLTFSEEYTEQFFSFIRSALPPSIPKGEYFDVFLAHNSEDKAHIEQISKKLRERGVSPWLDKEQVPPGRWFQDVIQQAIRKVKSAAVFIGPSGVGKWQALELRSFISLCIESGCPVIPVLLPGVYRFPNELLFLKELNWVQFSDTVHDEHALDSLVWGITGNKPDV